MLKLMMQDLLSIIAILQQKKTFKASLSKWNDYICEKKSAYKENGSNGSLCEISSSLPDDFAEKKGCLCSWHVVMGR